MYSCVISHLGRNLAFSCRYYVESHESDVQTTIFFPHTCFENLCYTDEFPVNVKFLQKILSILRWFRPGDRTLPIQFIIYISD